MTTEPPTTPDPISRLEGLVPLCAAIRQGSEYTSALASATSLVGNSISLLDRLDMIGSVAKALADSPCFLATDARNELATIASVGNALEKCVDTQALRDVRFPVRSAQESIERLEKALQRAWSAMLKEDFEPVRSLGGVLAAVPDTKKAGTELQAWAQTVLDRAGKDFPTSADVNLVTDARSQRSHRLEELGAVGIDTEVSRFLIEVAYERATLAELTPKVLVWLISKKAESQFRIKLR